MYRDREREEIKSGTNMTRQWKGNLLDIYLANILSFLHDLSSSCLNRRSINRRQKLALHTLAFFKVFLENL